MENIKILYYLKEENSNVFYIELKRLEYKNSEDKSKYVCWFKILDNKASKLNFKKMEETTRYFDEGKLVIDKSVITFNQVKLENITDIDNNNVKLCIKCW